MSDMMIRKQIYLYRRQNQILKRLSKERGVSEAEIVRQALEREAHSASPVFKESHQVLEEMIAFARSLRQRPDIVELQKKPLRWSRQELYEERESRWFKPQPEQ